MSSAMIGKIVALHKSCKKEKISLKLSNIHSDIMEIFTLMNLQKLLAIYGDESEAIQAFESEGWSV